jgi:hypothetical protein
MGPLDSRNDELGNAQDAAQGTEPSDALKKTRVVVDIYPWYGAAAPTTAQVETATESLDSTGKKPPEK